jgi:hypothetical protein
MREVEELTGRISALLMAKGARFETKRMMGGTNPRGRV